VLDLALVLRAPAVGRADRTRVRGRDRHGARPLRGVSKYVFRIDDRQHLYKPTNFAIVAGLCFFPTTSFNLLSDEFTLSSYPLFHVLVLGSLAVWRGRTWQVTVGYTAAMFAYAAFAALALRESFVY
jgi:hypothetical protein